MGRLAIQRSAGLGYVAIQVNQPSELVAPGQVRLKAINISGLAPFQMSGSKYKAWHHEYYFHWKINGEPLAQWESPENLINEHNNPNEMFGVEVAFVFDDPGDYTIDLTVTDRNGKVATHSTNTITVLDPEIFFPAADRLYADPDGDFTDVPVGADTFDNLEDLRVEMNTRQNPTWVLLRKGKTFSLTGVDPNNGSENYLGCMNNFGWDNVRLISGFGAGDVKPVITPDTRPDKPYGSSMWTLRHPYTGNWRTVTGIEFKGWRDANEEHGAGLNAGGVVFSDWRTDDGFALVHKCKVSGLQYGFTIGGVQKGYAEKINYTLSDCFVEGWVAMGVFSGSPGTRLALLGLRLAQSPNAPNYGGKDGIRSNHGPIRASEISHLIVTGCDLFSRNHWDGNDQPCLRAMTNPNVTQEGGYVDRCVMEGGYQVVQMSSSDGQPMYAVNMVFERLMLIASTFTTTFFGVNRSGVTYRDSIQIRPDVEVTTAAGSFGEMSFLESAGNVPTPDLTTNPIVIHGITTMNLLSPEFDKGKSWPVSYFTGGANGTVFTNVVEENNIYHKPNMTTPLVPADPIDLATPLPGFTARYLGRRYNFEAQEFNLEEDVAPGETVTVPYTLIGDGLYEGTPSTGPTDQAYWLANAGPSHHVVMAGHAGKGTRQYYSDVLHNGTAHISVAFTETGAVVTNNGPETWGAGTLARFWFDRTPVAPAMLTDFANPETVPLPRPETGSPAIGAATSGRVSPKDFLLQDRGETPSQGAVEPETP